MDELGVHALDIGQHEQLFHRGVVAHVAVELRVGLAPVFRRLSEERDIEDVGLAGVGDRGLRRRDLRRDEVRLDGIGVNAVVELGKRAVEIPSQRQAAVLLLLEPAELFHQVNLELRADPHAELKGNIRMSIGPAVSARRGLESDSPVFSTHSLTLIL